MPGPYLPSPQEGCGRVRFFPTDLVPEEATCLGKLDFSLFVLKMEIKPVPET